VEYQERSHCARVVVAWDPACAGVEVVIHDGADAEGGQVRSVGVVVYIWDLEGGFVASLEVAFGEVVITLRGMV